MVKSSLIKNFGLVSALTIVSRITGFFRDIVFAQFLGASSAADAFFVAFKLPNLFRRLTAEGALTNSFLPAYSSIKIKKGFDHALIFAAEIQAILFLLLCIIVILIQIFMPFIIFFLAPGFQETPERMEAAIKIARFTIPYLPMVSLVALWSAITNANDDFFSGAFSPIIMNLFLIGSTFLIPFSNNYFNFQAEMIAFPIALGILLAGISQMIFLQIRLRRKRLNPNWNSVLLSKEGKKMWVSFFPAALGAGIIQINLFVDTILASFLKTGSISWLYYADRVAQLPLGIIGIALGTALLPKLSDLENRKEFNKIKIELTNAFKIGIFLSVPATFSILILSHSIISGLFEHGKFLESDVNETSNALICYSGGLLAFIFIKIIQPPIYAMKKSFFILKISILTIFLNITLSVILMKFLDHVGIALATSIAAWFGFVLHFIFLVKNKRINFDFLKFLKKTIFASFILSIILYYINNNYNFLISNKTLNLFVTVLLGTIIYFVIMALLGVRKKSDIIT